MTAKGWPNHWGRRRGPHPTLQPSPGRTCPSLAEGRSGAASFAMARSSSPSSRFSSSFVGSANRTQARKPWGLRPARQLRQIHPGRTFSATFLVRGKCFMESAMGDLTSWEKEFQAARFGYLRATHINKSSFKLCL